ncbi:Sugar (and other) transporter-like protein 27 [Elsinoe fawcettii]|nr:Sugar (and other) transporter-like protein 27 [Elsinoe fawcettii]
MGLLGGTQQSPYWHKLSSKALFRLIIAESALAISYEGISQGVMGAVNVAPEYGQRMGFMNSAGKVTRPSLQGGIVAIYYAGALLGGFWAGSFSDKYGRINGIRMACFWCLAGVILQASAVNLAHMLCARVVAGVAVSFILAIAPSWTAELSPAAHRGDTIATTFLANFSGIALASWIGFGTSFTEIGNGQFRWRFEFAIQCIPVIFVFIGTYLIPESPRWLIKEGRSEEGLDILARLRGDGDPHSEDVQREYQEIMTVVHMEKENQASSYIKIALGAGSGDIHLGRRVQLAFWLQVLMQYGTGIAAVVIYSGTIFRTAGFDDTKSNWLSALGMTVGILGTFIATKTLDRVGRRRTLYWGAITLSIILFIIGGLNRAATNNPAKSTQFGTAAAAFFFIYVLVFSSSWLMIPFIYPTEIFPTWIRAKGNAFGVAGWAVGFGGGSLLVPIMFAGIEEKTFYVFGAAMLLYIPIIYAFFPETSGRTLEAIDFLFASKSPFTWNEEKEFAKRMAQLQTQLGAQEKANCVVSSKDSSEYLETSAA